MLIKNAKGKKIKLFEKEWQCKHYVSKPVDDSQTHIFTHIYTYLLEYLHIFTGLHIFTRK